MVRSGLASLLVGLGLSTVGCSAPEAAPAKTVLAVAVPAATPIAESPRSLTRDAELTGNEHHVSMLEGKLTLKVHAVETPKLATRATDRGLLYSTLDVKLSDEQTVHCVAYASMVWPGGFVAADLHGEHDWANDGSEVSDEEAKTTSSLTRFDVTTSAGRPTVSARATVKSGGGEIVADRKVALTSTAEYTLSCSDRTVGFDGRFNALVGEAMGSLVVDPPSAAPTKAATYRVESEGKVVGYKMVETFADAKKGTTTFTNESEVKVVDGVIVGRDRAITSAANEKGEEKSIHVQVVEDGENVIENLHATKDKKGWRVIGIASGEVVDERYTSKTALVSEMSPAWNARIRAAASRKSAAPAKLTVLSPGGATAVVAKRNADGSIVLSSKGRGTTATLDADGVTSMITETTRYERIRFRAGSSGAPRAAQRATKK